MINVFLTIDVEIWCNGWNDLDKKFPSAYKQYIYGRTSKGDFGLPLQLKTLKDYGLKAVFFVEPLFSTRFGIGALQDVVGLIQEYQQEIQLHLHTEWVDEALQPLLPNITYKRQHIKQYSLEEQKVLIHRGLELLKGAGCDNVNAFRAGSFGANLDTLKALKHNQIKFDSSYNYTFTKTYCDIKTDQILTQPCVIDDIYEYPVSFFGHKEDNCRHAQLGACSSREMKYALLQALKQQWKSFVILSHNFELLNNTKTKPDPIVVRRFNSLCEFLSNNQNQYQTAGFNNLIPAVISKQPNFIKPKWTNTNIRILEQALRRFY